MRTPISKADPETHRLGLGKLPCFCLLLLAVMFLLTVRKAAARWRGGRERGGFLLPLILNFFLEIKIGFFPSRRF
jgi:hypothetical protein